MPPPACSAPGRPASRPRRTCRSSAACRRWCARTTSSARSSRCATPRKQAMKVAVAPRATLLELAPQNVDIPAGEAREVAWTVTAPAQLALHALRGHAVGDRGQRQPQWRARCAQGAPAPHPRRAADGAAGHAGADRRPVQPARGAARRRSGTNGTVRGGLKLALQPKLAEGLPGVRDWFARYPFACLEQKTSKSIGLRDGKLWQGVVAQIPTYLDADGLASYFPPREGDGARGSDILTAYLLAATHEAASLNPAFALSDEVRAPDGARPDRVCRRPHPAQLLVAAERPGRAQARRHRGAVALRQGPGPPAGQPHPRAQPVADQRGDRLAEHPQARERRAAARAAAG